jgi:tripartite-type tricarboxylate transporter receptor subunit TctC
MSSAAQAQSGYPSRPIKFVVPFPPGGNLDFVARNLQPKMQEVLGQPVVIDNKGGNAGMIGLEYAAKQPGDGYTIVLGNTGTIAINQSVYPKMNYDAVKDFVAIGITTAEFAAFIRSGIVKWGRVAKEANIKIDP